MSIWVILSLIFGSVVGSFLGALTYRLPKGISIASGRSKCPNCGKTIAWYDNIPMLSFLLLQGKCRKCKYKISLRYPAIELGSALMFLTAYLGMDKIFENLPWLNASPAISFGIILVFLTIFIAIFVIDWEQQLILDEFVFFGLALLLGLFITFNFKLSFNYLLTGFGASLFLLAINLITKGRGMGLGDVKFALLAGSFLGFPNALIWLFLAFIIGGIVGIILIVLGKAKLSQKIAFGPFLVASLFLTLLFGKVISATIIPYGFWVF